MNIFEKVEILKNNQFLIRKIDKNDLNDLFKVYSDEKAVPFFNGDGCNGDTFHYQTIDRMSEALSFWLEAYDRGWFVRWSIIDLQTNEVIGTIEGCYRVSNDVYNDSGVIRIDLRSDYEKAATFESIFSLILKPAYQYFNVKMIFTKGFPLGSARIQVLKSLGFEKSEAPLLGNNQSFFDYWTRKL